MLGLGMKGFYTTIDPGNKNTPHWSEINGCSEVRRHPELKLNLPPELFFMVS